MGRDPFKDFAKFFSLHVLILKQSAPHKYCCVYIQELTNLVTGMAFIRFRHHRVLQRICTELLHPHRLQRLTTSQAIALMRSMTDLDVLDSQFLTTMILKVRNSLQDVQGPEIVSALVSISTGKLEDVSVANALVTALLSPDKFDQLMVEDLSDLLEVALSIDLHASTSGLDFAAFIVHHTLENESTCAFCYMKWPSSIFIEEV